jgi:hypothetical protein
MDFNFPIEVWCLILSHLGYWSIRFATVSKTFYNHIVFHCITDLTSLLVDCFEEIFSSMPNINDEFIQRFCNLETLDMYYFGQNFCDITDIGIMELKNLTSVSLYRAKAITDEGLKCLTNITKLHLYENDIITDEGIKGLHKLKELDLYYNFH